MSTIVEVGHKVLEVADKLEWTRLGHMEYGTTVSGHLAIVTKEVFQVRLGGDELDTAKVDYSKGDTGWIGRLWRHAHEAVIEQEKVFEDLLNDLERLGAEPD